MHCPHVQFEWTRRTCLVTFSATGPDFGPSCHCQLTVREPTHFFFGIEQDNGGPNIDAKLMVLSEDGKLVLDNTLVIDRRSLVPARLEPGRYRIIPYSSGCRLSQIGKPVQVNLTVDADVESSAELTSSHVEREFAEHALIESCKKVHPNQFAGGNNLYILTSGVVKMYVVEMNAAQPSNMTVTFNFTKSINVVSAFGELRKVIELKPGEQKLIQILGPRDLSREVTYRHELEW